MELIGSLVRTIDRHPSVSLILTALAAWLVHRIASWNERKNVLRAIKTELDTAHQYWLRNSWPESRTRKITDYRPFVFKIETTAADNAIVRGSILFINDKLIEALIAYKQAISSFNQLVDSAHSFQSNIELWDKSKRTKDIEDHAIFLQQRLHEKGIGDDTIPAAHLMYKNLKSELDREDNSKVLPIIWLITGFSFFRIKEFICKYL